MQHLRLVLVWNISIHALRKESDDLTRGRFDNEVISIHALRKESDG